MFSTLMFSALKNGVKHWNVFSIDVFSTEKYGETRPKVKRFQRWKLKKHQFFHYGCDPLNFKALKICSISWLNLDFVAFSLLVKKLREQYGEIRLKAFHFQCWKRRVQNKAKLGWKRATFMFNFNYAIINLFMIK